MRVKARWFRDEHDHRPDEVAGAVAFIAFRVAQNMLKSMRKAGFDIDAGEPYFEFLSESLAFAIQCACRVAWPRLEEPARQPFAQALALRAADHLAGNQADLLQAADPAAYRDAFIERLNHRFAEYADFGYGPEGPDFGFVRYFASLVADRVPEKDRHWVHDQVIAIEGPEGARTLSGALESLFDTGPDRKPRRRRASTTGE